MTSPSSRSPVTQGAEKSLPHGSFDGASTVAVVPMFQDVVSVTPLTAFAAADGVAGALSVLIVEPCLDDLVRAIAILSAAGFHVTAAANFDVARTLVGGVHIPDVLFTTLRLGMYNGLHLVVHGHTRRPTMAALVTAAPEDASLQSDAELLGATFMLKPTTPQECIAAICQTVFRRDRSAGPIRAPFERRRSERRGAQQSTPEERRQGDRRRTMPWLRARPGD